VAILSRGVARGIGFCKLTSTENEADLDIADLIDSYVRDEANVVIAAYIEGIRSVKKFRAAAIAAWNAGKPLVVYKVGRSNVGARPAVLHTSALAGEDRAYNALFRQVGAIRAQSIYSLLYLPAMLESTYKMRSDRVVVLTSTGGVGNIVADNCGVLGLGVPELDPTTKALLASDVVDGVVVGSSAIGRPDV